MKRRKLDGDLSLLVKNKMLSDACNMDLPIVLNIDDKATVLKEKINSTNITNAIIRSMTSMVGEITNIGTKIINIVPRNEEEKAKYEEYMDLLSIAVGSSIDFQKTGIMFLPPRKIVKVAKLVPYFMKYISPYYAKIKRYSYSSSNMNQLCKDIERWESSLKRKTTKSQKSQPFDYSIMLDLSIPWNQQTYLQVEKLYEQFLIEYKELRKQQFMSYKSPEYYNYFSGYNQKDVQNTNVDWKVAFEKYKKESRKICSNQKELANYAVTLCYADEKSNKEKNFAWIVAENGIVANIKPQEILLPVYDLNGEYEYLGKKYKLVPYIYDENRENDSENDNDIIKNNNESYIDIDDNLEKSNYDINDEGGYDYE